MVSIIKMPSKNPTIKKAFKDGVISKGQYEKMNDGLLLGIIKKKKKVPRKGTKRKPSGVSAPSTRASARGQAANGGGGKK